MSNPRRDRIFAQVVTQPRDSMWLDGIHVLHGMVRVAVGIEAWQATWPLVHAGAFTHGNNSACELLAQAMAETLGIRVLGPPGVFDEDE
jgi:hypothetical protein